MKPMRGREMKPFLPELVANSFGDYGRRWEGWREQLSQDMGNKQAPQSQEGREGCGEDKVRREWAVTGQHHESKGSTILQTLQEVRWRI